MATINIADKDTLDSVNTKVGTTSDTGGTASAGSLMAKLNKIITDITTFVGNWTSTRAGYIDNIRSYTITNNTASKTGVLSAKLAYIISLLENTTYGLSALKTATSSGGSVIKSIQSGSFSPTYDATTATITISAVDTSKSIVITNGYLYINNSTQYSGWYCALTNSTTLTLVWPYHTMTSSKFYWQVIEFI